MRPIHRDARVVELKVAVALPIQEADVVVRPVEAGLDLVLRVSFFRSEMFDRDVLALLCARWIFRMC